MQLGRGLALMVGVAVVVVAGFLYFGGDRTASEKEKPGVAGTSERRKLEPPSPEKIETLDKRLEAFREKNQEAQQERAARRAAREAAAAATSPEAGSTQAAADPSASAARTGAGQARESRPTVVDRAQIEALLSGAANAPAAKAPAPSGQSAPGTPGESAPKPPGERTPESKPGTASVGSPVEMSCASDPWICNAFNLAFQLPGTIPAASGGREGIFIRTSPANGEVWVKEGGTLWRIPTTLLTDPGQVAAIASKAGH